MKSIHLDKNIIASIPNNWGINIGQGGVSLFDPINGVGAVQFSFYTVHNPYSLNLADELDEYLKDKYENVQANLLGDLAYVSLVSSSGILWRYWLLRKMSNIIFVSYNCKKEDIVDNIIQSVAIK